MERARDSARACSTAATVDREDTEGDVSNVAPGMREEKERRVGEGSLLTNERMY